MRFPEIEEVRAYWEALRGAGDIPFRAQVDPRGIERALETAFILERLAPGVARIRLAGMHLNDLMGMEVRGMPLTALFLPEARAELGRRLEAVFAAPARVELDLAGDRGLGRPPLDGAALLLPLRSNAGEVSRAIGCLVTRGPIGRSPRRLAVAGARVLPLGPVPAITGAPPAAPATRAAPGAPERSPGPAPGLAEAPVPFAPARGGRPQLRLVRPDE